MFDVLELFHRKRPAQEPAKEPATPAPVQVKPVAPVQVPLALLEPAKEPASAPPPPAVPTPDPLVVGETRVTGHRDGVGATSTLAIARHAVAAIGKAAGFITGQVKAGAALVRGVVRGGVRGIIRGIVRNFR